MAYRVVNNRTGVCFTGDDLRRALQMVLVDHAGDVHVAVGIDALAAAIDRGDQLLTVVWTEALNVTVSTV